MTESIDINQILTMIPHRYPMILIDKVLDYKPYEYLMGIKNVSANEPFFQGHFPGNPIMPGVLMLESLAQASAVLFSLSKTPAPGNRFQYYFAGIDKVKFKQIVLPGDQLELKVSLLAKKREFWRVQAEAMVRGELVCSAELLSVAKEVSCD